jgi:hypothetical protein
MQHLLIDNLVYFAFDVLLFLGLCLLELFVLYQVLVDDFLALIQPGLVQFLLGLLLFKQCFVVLLPPLLLFQIFLPFLFLFLFLELLSVIDCDSIPDCHAIVDSVQIPYLVFEYLGIY